MASANGRSSASISLTLGLMSVPVKMYSATSDHKGKVSFNQISPAGNTVKQKLFDSVTDTEVQRKELRKGYRDGDDMIIFEAEEIKALESHKACTVQIEQFVPLRTVNMAHVEKTYNCNPDPKAGVDKAFLALSMVMAAKEVGGVAKWYARGRENLVVITGNGESIQVHQMKYENEINDFVPDCAKVDVHEQELALLGQLVDNQTVDSYGHSDENPSLYRDCYAERVREAVDAKRSGGQVKAAKKADAPVGGDLLSMLQASVKQAPAPAKKKRAKKAKKAS